MVGNDQVAGGGDRQVFRDPLDETEHEGIADAQLGSRVIGSGGDYPQRHAKR